MTLREFVDRYCNGRKRAFTLFARMTPPCVTEKFCPDCQTRKSLAEFTKHAGHPDGLNSTCTLCKTARRHRLHGEKERKDRRDYYYKNREVESEKSRQYYEANIDRLRQACREWRARYPDRQARASGNWSRNNRARRTSLQRARDAAKIQRTPPWLTPKQIAEVDDFYHLAEALNRVANEFYEVDHIVPLRGRSVSGLHVPWNLQLLTTRENCIKGNRYESQ